jgi:hypothetical protein
MKKKFFFGILFSAILAINVISVSKTDVSDLSLTSLIRNANAQTEGPNCPGGTCTTTYAGGGSCTACCAAGQGASCDSYGCMCA